MEKSASIYGAGLLLLFIVPLTGMAETIYIDNKVMVGLHQDKDIDSAIIKLLPGGTALEVVKREAALTQVKEPDGSSGWIDNHYLVDTAPGRTQAVQLQDKISKLEGELTALKAGQNTTPSSNADNQKQSVLANENEELKQQLQSAQLKMGELQAQAAELRNKLSREISDEKVATDSSAGNTEIKPATNAGAANLGWRAILIGFVVCLIAGLTGGALLMDWDNRRRHGGFRI